MKKFFSHRKQMTRLCLFFSFLIILGYGIKIYGASGTAYIYGVVNLKAGDENGKLVFKSDGLKLDSNYTSENTIVLSNGNAKFEMFLITDKQYKTQWLRAKNTGNAKLMAQRTFTKSSSNNYEWGNDLSGTYTVTDTAAMKKALEWESSPQINKVFSFADYNTFQIQTSQNFFLFNYYYFYTKEGSYTIGNNPVGISFNIMCSVNGGEWKQYDKQGVSTSIYDFDYDDFNIGDTIKIKLVDNLGMGYESNTIEVKIYGLTIDANGGTFFNTSGKSAASEVKKFSLCTDVGKNVIYNTNIAFNSEKVYSSSSKTVSQPKRNGYTFNGWKITTPSVDGGNITSEKYNDSYNVYKYSCDYAGNVTISAQWEQNTYTLSINPNGGSMNNGSTATTSSFTTDFVYGRKTYIGNLNADGTYKTLNVPTREGYIFTGWNFSNGTGGQNTSGDKFYFSDTSTYGSNTNTYIFNGDYKGNVTATAQWKDSTPPEWITKDSNGNKVSGGLYVNPSSWTKGNAVIKAEARDTGSGMSNVKIYNGSSKELATGVSSAEYTQSAEGITYFYAVATDKAGNKTTTEKKAVYVDKTPPAITSGVSSSGWTNQDIRLTATATDALSGVQKVEIYTSSGKLAASGKTGASYTITAQTNEEYIIRATDAAGNVAEKKQSIQIDKENSDVIIDSGNDTPSEFKPGAEVENCIIGWINKDVPIKVIATDNMSGIKSIELKDHYGYVIKSDTKELQYIFTNEGISHYVITVTDNAGNTKTINLTVKIDKTPPEIIGEEEVKDPNYGLIEHQAVDTLSGIKTFKLYYYDTMQEVTEADGLEYKDGNIIYFKSMNTFNLYWKLIAEDNAGNITEMIVHTPFNFKIKVETDNLRTETENFLIGADAQLKITLWGYVDTVEVKFERTLENAAEKEEYTLDRLIESGDAFVRVPEKNDYVEYTFKLPEGVDPREYRIWVYGYRDGWKRTEYVDINLITYDQLCKEQVHKFKRVIKSPTWRKVDEYIIEDND